MKAAGGVMNVRRVVRFTLFILNAAMASTLFAQGGGGRLYNPSTETTVQGKVSTVDAVTGRRGWSGIHLTVESKDTKYNVHVGPATFVEQHGFKFAVGDHVDILGSEVIYNGAKSLIAREIKKDGKPLVLRDKQGFPVWSGAGATGN
jgi:hypothetical protein